MGGHSGPLASDGVGVLQANATPVGRVDSSRTRREPGQTLANARSTADGPSPDPVGEAERANGGAVGVQWQEAR
jgi:hypothetical protein